MATSPHDNPQGNVAPPAEIEPEAPGYGDDADSAYGDDTLSETTSISSTILQHRKENGRTYHSFRAGENDYYAPNDEQQNAQLDLGHHMLTQLLGGNLYLCPLPESCHRVIDVGCGTGIWAIDFADDHPDAEVIGTDLSAIQPHWVPPNCKFVIDDCSSDWNYPPGHFDFVHVRCLYGSISDWPALYRQVFLHTKPGGYFEEMEMSIEFRSDDGTIDEHHIMSEWSRTFLQAGERMGKTMRTADHAATLIREAGFVDVVERWFKLPLGVWPKDKNLKKIGLYNHHFVKEGLEGWAMYLLTRIMHWSVPEVQIFIAKMKNALDDRSLHGYYRVVVVYGRRP